MGIRIGRIITEEGRIFTHDREHTYYAKKSALFPYRSTKTCGERSRSICVPIKKDEPARARIRGLALPLTIPDSSDFRNKIPDFSEFPEFTIDIK